ncbi:MAG TPA: hypothetical protein VF710_02610 [Longimicrobium sp.]|jgi:hypothetical protein
MGQETREKEPRARPADGGVSGDHRQDQVEVIVNNVPVTIHRGRQTVEEIKRAGGVALADELVQVVDGKLTGLADGDAVVIKGVERFISQPRDSASSHEEEVA